ncbi:hypothetical protein AB0D04_10620 [Streptomyces sp. NPDC048483]|uniref:hypothetical protein n=1 Tax=Streptomyces sp. NPDC048483 TaxID=3154927 RepID=UPI00342B65A0
MSKWEELLAAEREVARCRAEVYQSSSRIEMLTSALRGSSSWDRSAAMTFLRLFPGDVLKLLEELVEYSLSQGWAADAREVIRAARNDGILGKLNEIVLDLLAEADSDDYLRLADMLAYVGAWETLSKLVDRACSSNDPEIREVGQDFRESYVGMLPT